MTVEVVIALILRDGRWFLQRRDPAGEVLPGLWEFPGGKIEGGETPEAALRRELQEELSWTPDLAEPLAPVFHDYPARQVVLRPFRCEGRGVPSTELGWGWFLPGEAAKLPVPEANHRLIRMLADLAGGAASPSSEGRPC